MDNDIIKESALKERRPDDFFEKDNTPSGLLQATRFPAQGDCPVLLITPASGLITFDPPSGGSVFDAVNHLCFPLYNIYKWL